MTRLASQADFPVNRERVTWGTTLAILVGRTVLFAAAQAVIAALFALSGRTAPWQESAAWWPYTAGITGLITFMLLRTLLRREGFRLRDLLSIDRKRALRDGLLVVGLSLLGGPLAYFPMGFLATWLFGDPMAPVTMMFRPLPLWAAYGALFVFPTLIALTELPTYFGYVMARLEALSGSRWLAVVLAGFWLRAQHMTLPLLFDWRFAVWRLAMYLPFALYLGIILRWKPRLLPYLMVVHLLIDLQAAIMVLAASR